jgi:hypothetical protein
MRLLERAIILVPRNRTLSIENTETLKKFAKFRFRDGAYGNKMEQFIDRLKWPLHKDEFESAVAVLQRFAQTFQFSLTISNG